MQDMGDDCLGLRVVVRAKEAVFMGVINYILPTSRRLALEKVRVHKITRNSTVSVTQKLLKM